MNRPDTPAWVALLVLLFGLPFLGIGTGLMYRSVQQWRLCSSTARWPQVPATLSRVEMETLRHLTEDQTECESHRVAADYSYSFEGRRYAGNRVAINTDYTSDDGTHQRRYETLRRHMKVGRPFAAYVDPRNPTQAVLFREPDFAMYATIPAGLAFGLAGLAVEALGVWLLYGSRQRAPTPLPDGRTRHRQGPLNAGPPVTTPRARRRYRAHSSAGAEIALAWLMGILVACVVSPFLMRFGEMPPLAQAMVIAFTAFAFMLLRQAIWLSLAYAVHGMPLLVLEQTPARPGQTLHARLRVSRRPLANPRVSASLTCTRRVRTSDDTSEDQDILNLSTAIVPIA